MCKPILGQEHLDLESFQEQLMSYWKDDMEGQDIDSFDATCYETSMRYPTSVKILWESCEWINGQMIVLNRAMKGRMPLSKYIDQKIKYLSYQKCRKKTYKMKRRRIRSLLYLLHKLLGQLEQMLDRYGVLTNVHSPNFSKRLEIIKKVYDQQHQWYESGAVPKGLIVSIDKDYDNMPVLLHQTTGIS